MPPGGLPATPALAQFSGPGAAAPTTPVAGVQGAGLSTRVAMLGNTGNHQWAAHVTVRDNTGELGA